MSTTERWRGGVLAAVLLLTGCASVPPKGGFDGVQSRVHDRLGGAAVAWNQGGEEDAAAAQVVDGLLARPLTADAAVQIALLNNRHLQATYEDLGVSQAELVQAGLLKNPRFSAEYLPPTEAGPVPLVGLELAQDFLDLFFRDLRKKIAAAEFEAAQARVTAAVLSTAGRTREAYLDAQMAQQLLELRQTVLDATLASQDAAQKLYDAGNTTPLSLAGERALAGQASLDTAEAQARVASSRERLNRLMGLWGARAGAWTIDGRLPEAPAVEAVVEDAERRAIEASLDLAVRRSEFAAAAQRAGLTNWSAVLSQVELGVAADREDDGAWHVGPSVSLELPLFDQGQAEKAAAAAAVRRALAEYAAAAVDVRSAARALRDRLVLAQRRAAYYKDAVLPLRETVVEQTQLEYNAMQVGVFQLLAAKRDQIDAAAAYLVALHDYHVARAGLDLLFAGLAPDSLDDSRESQP